MIAKKEKYDGDGERAKGIKMAAKQFPFLWISACANITQWKM